MKQSLPNVILMYPLRSGFLKYLQVLQAATLVLYLANFINDINKLKWYKIMVFIKPLYLVTIFFFSSNFLSAQVDFLGNPTDEQLIQVFEGNNVSISNTNLTSGIRDKQVALFQNGIQGANLEIDKGIYFSTGDFNFELTNTNVDNSSNIDNMFTYEDEDLLLLEENAIYDVVLFEFDIQISEFSDGLSFTYQFGSEEYPDYVGSVYNDLFAIFISGPGFSSPTNIAQIPTTGNPTAVNFVNGGVLGSASTAGVEVDLTQTQLYINNGHLNTGVTNPIQQPGPFVVDVEFNGITTSITSQVQNLIPGETYQIKIALADTADGIYDSGVFFSAINANSIQPEVTFLKEGLYLGNPTRANPNDEVLYVFDIINEGDVPVRDISFEDDFFENNEIEGLSDVVLAPGESYSFELNYFIDQQEINQGALYNLANINYEVDGENYQLNSIDPTPLAATHPLYDASCMACTVVLLPQQPQIALIKTATIASENLNIQIGDQITYNFSVQNTGNVDLFNLQIFDDLPGIEMMGEPIDLMVGELNETHFSATYLVSPSDFANRRIENQALASAFTFLNEEVIDLSDFELNTEDRPTLIELPPCQLQLFNTITPNNDGVNDNFIIEGIECYPDNRLRIFNRWGVEVFNEKSYNNTTIVFDGTSSGRATLNAEKGLPTGVYFYVLQYVNDDNENIQRKGTIYIKQEN